MNKGDFAIVVGISRYGSLQPQLEGPERDASAFEAWLKDPDGGALPDDNITTVLSSKYLPLNSSNTDPYLYEPTLVRVTSAFAKLMALTQKNFARTPRVGRRLYIFLSGHGLTGEVDPVTSTQQSALAMANCVEGVFYECLPGMQYAEWFKLSHAFDEILLFMDCCRDDRPEVKMRMSITTEIVDGGRPNDVRTFYAFATQWDSRAYEMPLGTPAEKRGVFTYALIEALRRGTPDALGRLTPRSIVGHLALRVPQLRNGDGSQRPQFIPPLPDDSIVLVERAANPQTPTLTITFDKALNGQQAELQSGRFESIRTDVITDAAWSLALSPGTYVVVIGGVDHGITLRPGEIKTEHISA